MTAKKTSLDTSDITARFIGEYDGGITRADVLIGGCLELRSASLIHGQLLTFPYVNKREAVAVSEGLGSRIKAAIIEAKTDGRTRTR